MRGETRHCKPNAAVLSEQNRFEDAAVTFLAAGNMLSAYEQYAAAGEWRMALALSGAHGSSDGWSEGGGDNARDTCQITTRTPQ